MVWIYIWKVMELAFIFVAWVLCLDYEIDGKYYFPVIIEDYEKEVNRIKEILTKSAP